MNWKTNKWVVTKNHDFWEKDEVYDITEVYEFNHKQVVDVFYNNIYMGKFISNILKQGFLVPLSIFRNNQINSILTDMTIFRYENTKEEITDFNGPVIFLAGPTVRGNQYDRLGPSWRVKAVELLAQHNFSGAVVLPEFTNPYESDKYRVELPIWEHNGLTRADCILFWIPRTRELIGLNTNSEMGYWTAKQPFKLTYGRPDDAFRIAYNDIMWKQVFDEFGTERPIFNDLESLVKESILMATLKWQK